MSETFSFQRNYRRIDCDEPGYEGFWIKVRAGVSNDERDALIEAWAEISAYNVRYQNMEPAEKVAIVEADDTPRRRQWALLAPYIVGWNAVGETTDGEEKGMAPPAENGPAVFGCVPVDLFVWMWGVVADGYIASGKARDSLPKSIATSGPQIVPLPANDERPAKRRRANS